MGFPKPSPMPTSIITTDDLYEFKLELLESLEGLFQKYADTNTAKTWLRSDEVKKQLKISHGTLQNLRNKGILKAHKLEGILFYDAAEIDKALLQRQIDYGKYGQ